MGSLTEGTRGEIQYRLDSLKGYFDIKPENAIDDKKAFAYKFYGGTLHEKGFYLHMLGRQEESEEAFSHVVPYTRAALRYCNHQIEESKTQNLLFERALLVGSVDQATESANIVSRLGITEALVSQYYLILAKLFLGQFGQVEKLLPELTKLENKKYLTQIKLGTVRAVKALCDRDVNEFRSALSEILDNHIHQIRYLKYPMGLDNFVSFPSTLLCIIALKFEINVRPSLSNANFTAKTRPLDALHRSDVSPKHRFYVPIDLVPDLYIKAWQ